MRWQTTALLAVILLGLGAFYYVYEVRLAPEREKAEARKGRVFTAEPGDVTELDIRRGAERIRLVREGDGWRMAEPVATRGDRGTIDETVTTVVTAKMDREIAAAPSSLGDFGLATPAAEITAKLKDGKSLALQLGAKNPTGVWVYAKEPDKPAVFVLPEGVLRDATRPLADFRDKSVLAFDRNAVTGVEIAARDETIAIEPAGGAGKWKITRPVALPADPDTVRDLLDKLGSARVKEFVAEAPPSLQPFGLDRPLRIAVHTGRDKERATKTLLLGRLDDATKGLYAQRPGEPTVFLLPEEIDKAIPKNVAVLRDKTVVEFDRDKVNRVEIVSPRGPVTLAREDNRWRIVAPQAMDADPVEVGAFLRALGELKAQAFVAEDVAGVTRYLSKPEVQVTLTGEGGAATTVVLAPSPERRGGKPSAYAAVAGRGPVALVDGSALTDVGRAAADLRDRTLVGGLEPKDVTKVTVKSGGKAVVIERSGDAEWRMVEPSKEIAKGARVDDLLYTLRGLKWKEVVAPKAEDAARYGLDAPALEVALARADGSQIAVVQMGKQEDGRTYVRTGSSPTVYAVEARSLADLPKSPDDFKG
jgi:hypothetical protein